MREAACNGSFLVFVIMTLENEKAKNIFQQRLSVSSEMRVSQMGQFPCVYWFTGLPCSGKSTLSNALDLALHNLGLHTYLLDGDNLRMGLNRDLGFALEDRCENVRRLAEVACLMADAGLIVMVAAVSPSRVYREMARAIVGNGRFVEIFVSTPIEVCEERDVKGLYRRARKGEITGFTGVDSPYEPPLAAELVIDTVSESAVDAATRMARYYKERFGATFSQ